MKRLLASVCCLASLTASGGAGVGPESSDTQSPAAGIPQVLRDAILPQSDDSACGEHPKARELARLIMADKNQQRVELTCNPVLSRVAAEKAREMADKGIVSHYASSKGANTRLRLAGYSLPSDYPSLFHNQVEAVAGGFATAPEAWEAFKDSDDHRSHLLGEIPFFREQNEIGVGFYRKWHSPHVEYWAVYVARQGK